MNKKQSPVSILRIFKDEENKEYIRPCDCEESKRVYTEDFEIGKPKVISCDKCKTKYEVTKKMSMSLTDIGTTLSIDVKNNVVNEPYYYVERPYTSLFGGLKNLLKKK